MSSLETLRAAYGRVSDSELRWVAERARTTAGALSPEAWLALTEEMERRRLTPPHEIPAGVELDLPPESGSSAVVPLAGAGRLSRYAKAPILNRLVAHMMDLAIATAPALVVVPVGLAFGASGASPPSGTFVLAVIAAIGWGLFYILTKDGWGEGQSIGKRVMGLMVVNEATNEPCSRWASVARMLILWGLSGVPLVGWLIEPVMVLANDDGRRLGDRAAGTKVIEARDYRATATSGGTASPRDE